MTTLSISTIPGFSSVFFVCDRKLDSGDDEILCPLFCLVLVVLPDNKTVLFINNAFRAVFMFYELSSNIMRVICDLSISY